MLYNTNHGASAAGSMDMSRFKQMAQSLRDSSTFADFTIRCDDREYAVHRFVLACHSDYFKACFEGKYRESHNNTMEFHNKEAEFVESMDVMMDYFYAFDYDDEPKDGSVFYNAMDLNAAMYAIAVTYQVAELQRLARRKFGKAAADAVGVGEDPLRAIQLVYSSTTDNDRGLRDICVQLWIFTAAKIIDAQGKERVQAFLDATPAFGSDLIFTQAELMRTARATGICKCHHQWEGIDAHEAIEHDFGENVGIKWAKAFDCFWAD